MEATDLARKTAEVANRYAGKMEDPRGSNSDHGGPIDQALAYVSLEPGAPYCASECSWWVHLAAGELGVTPEFHKSGSALGLVRANPNLIIKPEDLTAADLPCIGINEHSDHVHGHAFLCVGVDDTGKLQTIDPNSDPHGGREGIGIFLLDIRSTTDAQRICYIRIA